MGVAAPSTTHAATPIASGPAAPIVYQSGAILDERAPARQTYSAPAPPPGMPFVSAQARRNPGRPMRSSGFGVAPRDDDTLGASPSKGKVDPSKNIVKYTSSSRDAVGVPANLIPPHC